MVGIPLDHLIGKREQILLALLRNRVAPVGRDEPVVRVVHAERGGQAADHATGSIRPALLLFDAFYEHVVLRRVCRELQHNLVCPIMHRVGELLIRLGTLLVRPNLHFGVELPPELEVNTGHLEVANKVPCGKRVVELFSRVEGGEKLRLGDDVFIVSSGKRNGDPKLCARTWPPMNSSSVKKP